ncbi:MAG: terpene cyclase/mutase family protein, partial [Kiritimatiellae bacterium]|nr:terpene cyclase/mutase family protein [Kiritimatiellia bacterium]
MHTKLRLICPLSLLTVSLTLAETNITLKTTSITPGVSESLTREASNAIQRGMDWLLTKQQPDGHWSNPEFPALTALPLWALARGGCTDTQAIDKATQCILSYVQEDGSIWRKVTDGRKGGGLPNYNTAICMVALRMLHRPELAPVILKARDYMAKNQHLTGHDSYYGGFGYDPATKSPYTDLSNSYLAFEAMKIHEDVEDLRPDGEPK